MGSSESFLDN